MGFQSAVFINTGFGVPGELFSDGPSRAQSYTIDSALASYNNIGSTFCSITSQGFCAAGNPGGNSILAGLLVDPKNIALFGTGGVPLAPTLNVPNFTQVECATMGDYVVTLPGAANIGDNVIFDNVTGAISTQAPSAVLPAGKTFANAVVSWYTVSGAGLGVITLTPSLVAPQPV